MIIDDHSDKQITIDVLALAKAGSHVTYQATTQINQLCYSCD